MAIRKQAQEGRISFASVRSDIGYPDFLDIQLKSFEDFFQLNAVPGQRKDEGLYKAIKENFPVTDTKGLFTLEFLDYALDLPKYMPRECIRKGVTYSVPLKAKLRLTANDETEDFDTIEEDVFLGNIPYMTERGSFIINGVERVVVSQIHKSPGVFFAQSKHISGAKLFSAKIIPSKGAWVEFATDVNQVMYAYIDGKKKFPITLLLRAIGYGSDQDILDIFGLAEEVKVSAKGLKGKIGRKLAARVLRVWSEEFIDEETGEVVAVDRNEVLVERDEQLTEAMITDILAAGIEKISLYREGVSAADYSVMLNTFHKDDSNSTEEAIRQIYRQLRNAEPPDEQSAREAVHGLFFSPNRYDLGRVGRYKINKKLNLEGDEETFVLTQRDIISIIQHLLDLINGKAQVDDIDHLSNRRVRVVGEQLYNQFSVGLTRIAKTARERMNVRDSEDFKPSDLINSRTLSSVVNAFFGTNPLSQFMDQVNPLADISHKRRISALGPGGLPKERAGFEVRDIHYTHYGRLCTIETPEGPNIGLISSLCVHAKVNNMGFIETPYYKVKEGKVDWGKNICYLTADEENAQYIAPAKIPLDGKGKIQVDKLKVRYEGDFPLVTPEKVAYMDVVPNQIVSVAASMIPFFEHDDASRTLMGSNMQRQAVPLLQPQAPIVGTGLEKQVVQDFRGLVRAAHDGTVVYVDAEKITVEYDLSAEEEKVAINGHVKTYELTKFKGTNQGTCINLSPTVLRGEKVKKGQLLCAGYSIDDGELALGKNVKVAFAPWHGSVYEDAICISEKLIQRDEFTSLHIEEFELAVRNTQFGEEELTREIPNVGDEALKHLDEDGIIRVGASVKEGDILVGKVMPKGEVDPTPEEKLLRAIFGEKAHDVKDVSLKAPVSLRGTVIDTCHFTRARRGKGVREKIKKDVAILQKHCAEKLAVLSKEMQRKLTALLTGGVVSKGLYHKFGEELVPPGVKFTAAIITNKLFPAQSLYADVSEEEVPGTNVAAIVTDVIWGEALGDQKAGEQVKKLIASYQLAKNEILGEFKREKFALEVGDELPNGVLQLVKVFIAKKRKLKVGDKMAGRHGNKGIVAKIVREEDMPFFEDGTPVDIVLNSLGLPSRMNLGQIYETILGWAGEQLGKKYATPIFDGASMDDIAQELKEANLPAFGRATLYDGMTGEAFEQKVTCGVIYMLKLGHLVDDKMHARSIGPYSLITQQPLGGKSQFGGQRLGEMEVWALEAFGAAHVLQEMLTIKSDDIMGRAKAYEAIVKGENIPEPYLPESFSVLVHELRGLGVELSFK